MNILTTLAIPLMLTTGLVWAQPATKASSKSSNPDRKTDRIHQHMVDKANASVSRAKTRVEKDPNRPIYHLQPPALWNNDPNGPIFYKGTYHLFYQHNPYGDNWGHMHWGHFKSQDLAHWQHMPIALAPSENLGEDHCFSGCATVTKNGQLMLIYTSIGKRLPEQWAAVPEDEDLSRWKKHPANPILTEKLHGPTKIYEWRDPFVFFHEGRHYLVTGGNLNPSPQPPSPDRGGGQEGRGGGQAVVNVYRAENEELTEWKYLGVLFQHPDANVKNIECPNFFKLGDKWVLIISQGQPVQYFVGSLVLRDGALREGEGPPEPKTAARQGTPAYPPRPPGPSMRFIAEKRGVMDYGNYYAPNCMVDGKGRRVLWGWVKDFPAGRGWNGCLTLPRILTLAPDGQLVQQPAPELHSLRETGGRGSSRAAEGDSAGVPRKWRVTDLQLTDSSKVLENIQGDALEIVARLDPGDAKSCGIRIRRSTDGRRGVAIAYDGNQLDVAGIRMPLAMSPDKRTLELHIFADHSVVEVYANPGLCLTRVIDAGPGDVGVEVFSKDGKCKLQSLDAWTMKSIWVE
jgi:beta-fructofuranosidase